MKMYNSEVLNDPHYTFSIRTENIKNRILILQQDLTRIQSYISCAIIEEEIEQLVDDYIEKIENEIKLFLDLLKIKVKRMVVSIVLK